MKWGAAYKQRYYVLILQCQREVNQRYHRSSRHEYILSSVFSITRHINNTYSCALTRFFKQKALIGEVTQVFICRHSPSSSVPLKSPSSCSDSRSPSPPNYVVIKSSSRYLEISCIKKIPCMIECKCRDIYEIKRTKINTV
jgi:hypothetical protein